MRYRTRAEREGVSAMIKECIENYIQKTGETKVQVARRLGTTPQVLGHLESGRRFVSNIFLFLRICELCEVSPFKFLEVEEKREEE